MILYHEVLLSLTSSLLSSCVPSAMASSQPFLASSPISPAAGRKRKSRFAYKHLSQLGLSSTTCPLRVIAHIDLDAFYAQCEGVRLGIAEDQPLAVQVCNNRTLIRWKAKATSSNGKVLSPSTTLLESLASTDMSISTRQRNCVRS